MESSAISVVRAFVTAINQHDTAAMSELVTEDHAFVDSSGTAVSGRDRMVEGWKGYFRMFPDYRVEVDRVFGDGPLVAAFGSAFGTYDGNRGMVPANRIEMPAAWKAVVEEGKVKSWQVYADWTEGYRVIEEDKRRG